LDSYAALEPLFNTGFRVSLGYVGVSNKHVVLFSRYGQLQREVKFACAVPTVDNVRRSILKMDMIPQVRVDMKRFQAALEATWSVLRPALEAELNYFPDFVMNTSATFPFTAMGFRRKSEVLSDPNFLDVVKDPDLVRCVWRVSGKAEMKSFDDISAQKIRTFIIPPLHLLWWQKVFFSGQDAELKTARWGSVRYGVSFAYGGFHHLMQRHVGRIIYFGDISGWDRLLAFMREVYNLRRRGLKISSDLESRFCWTVDNTVCAVLLLPNGDVVLKRWGNNSGGGSTTGDNCIAHEIVTRYIGLDNDYFADLFGDDFVGSCTTEIGDWVRKVYELFGFTLKFMHRLTTPVGVEFLGAKCVYYDGYYLPTYDSDRIYASMRISGDHHLLDEEVSKYYAFLFLGWNDIELFEELSRILVLALKDETIGGPMVEFLRQHGVPTRFQIIYNFWIGSESSLLILEGEVFKKVMKEFNVIQS